MYLVAYNHGLRASEVVGFRPVAVHGGEITIQRLKGSERTTHPLVDSEDALFSERWPLEEFIRNRPNSKPVFDISRRHYTRLFHAYALRAGIPEHLAHPHILKHSVAHQLVDVIGVPKLRTYLGHKSGASTLEYTKPKEKDAAAAAMRVLGGFDSE